MFMFFLTLPGVVRLQGTAGQGTAGTPGWSHQPDDQSPFGGNSGLGGQTSGQ